MGAYDSFCRDMFANFKKKTPFPAGYEQLQCLSSSGTQCIDTGMLITNTQRIKIDFVTRELVSNKYIFGISTDNSWKENYNFRIHSYGGGKCETRFNLCDWWEIEGVHIYLNKHYYIDYNKNNTYQSSTECNGAFNDTVYPPRALQTSNVSLGLFGANTSNGMVSTVLSSIDLYSCQVFNNYETLANNFTPALRISDNKAGLIDLENPATFLTNCGTGEFGYTKMNGSIVAPT